MKHDQKLELLDKQQKVGETMHPPSFATKFCLTKGLKIHPFDKTHDEMDSYL
jgi:hypothetical protein